MSEKLSIGNRFFAQIGTTAIIVVRAPSDPVELGCAGLPMVAEPPGDLAVGVDQGIEPAVLGKRYADPARGVEVLVTCAGLGPLTLDGVVLAIQQPRRLPASD